MVRQSHIEQASTPSDIYSHCLSYAQLLQHTSSAAVRKLAAAVRSFKSRHRSECPTLEAAFQLHRTVTLKRRPSGATQPSALAVCDVSSPSNPSSSPAGVRRAAGGVHDDEEVCAGPQAGGYTSPSAAYREPSAAVSDSRSAASQAVGGVDGDEASTDAAGSSGGTVLLSSPSHERVPVEWQLPSAMLE